MENLILAIFTALIFLVSYLFSWMHLYFISGAVLMLYGIACYVVLYIRTRNLINTRGVFLVFWLFAIGLAALKIHPKQVDWQVETWLCLGVSTVFFLLGYDAGNRSNRIYEFQVFRSVDPFWMIVLFSALIFLCFAVEVVEFRGLPILSRQMNAYVNFGLPFVHYMTVSCIMVPPVSLILLQKKKLIYYKKWIILACNLVMAVIPLLIVSRQLLIMEVLLFAFTWMQITGFTQLRKIKPIYIVLMIAAVLLAWVVLSRYRNQNERYLKIVLELDDKMSVQMYQIYMYIAFNFDNFNHFVGKVAYTTLGYSSLVPLWTYTGTKALLANLVNPDILKDVGNYMSTFTTYPFVCVPYMDAGILGVGIYSTVIGLFSGRKERKQLELAPVHWDYLSIALIDYCLIFSFFTAAFSNITVWTYFIEIFVFRLFTKQDYPIEIQNSEVSS